MPVQFSTVIQGKVTMNTEISIKKRRNLFIPNHLWEVAKRMGGGNASMGLRNALRQAQQAQQQSNATVETVEPTVPDWMR
jgi:hypothetical protein